MLARIEAFRSTQTQAVSVSSCRRPFQLGVHQTSAGQPLHGAGRMIGGGGGEPGPSSIRKPFGSPTRASGGPTVAGGTSAGSFGFGSRGSGGRIERVSRRTSLSIYRTG